MKCKGQALPYTWHERFPPQIQRVPFLLRMNFLPGILQLALRRRTRKREEC